MPIVCNLEPLSATQHVRHADLIGRLRADVVKVTDLPDGYVYELAGGGISLPELAEWIALESLCCPFLTFQLEVAQTHPTRLALRGPEGVKAILRQEFPEK